MGHYRRKATTTMNIHLHSALRIEVLEHRIAPATIYAVDTSNHLLKFDSATPGTVESNTNITGLAVPATETIRGIDFRPATGELYALGINNPDAGNDEGRIYKLNVTTGVLTEVGNTPFKTDFQDGNDYAFDFNPSVDRIRVTTDRDDNVRVNPNNGTLAGTDTMLTGGVNPAVVGLAYDHNFENATDTTLYGIDNNTDSLVIIGGINGVPSPNGGAVTVVGSLGVAFTNYKVGFDIESHSGTGYVVLRPTAGGLTSLYTINLTTGAATLVGAVGGNPQLDGMTVAPTNDLQIVNNTTATYTDQDGDKVTVKITGAAPGASLSPADFYFVSGEVGSQLKLLDFSDDGTEWAKASITITAVPLNGKGDSFATVGYIKATGIDLGKVSVNGDLGQIDVGDAVTSTPGLAGLTVQSLGVYTNSQLITISDAFSEVVGKLGSLTVKTEMTRAQINVTGGTDGAVGPVFIGGNLFSTGAATGISASGNIASVKLLGSLQGGGTTNSGSIIAVGNIGPVFVGGSIFGGDASNAGIIQSGGTMGAVTVKGSIYGGTDDHTGNIHSGGNMGAVNISGSIVGGTVGDPVNDYDSGLVYAFGGLPANIASVKVGGNIDGSAANGSYAGIYATGMVKTVTVLGSLVGGAGLFTGTVSVGGGVGTVKIGGDLVGGTGNYSGSLHTFNTGGIGNITIGGTVVGPGMSSVGIFSSNQLGAVKILGDLRSSLVGGARIFAAGGLNATTSAQAAAIKSVSIRGSVTNALIYGGYDFSGNAINPDATIGPVLVGGNWVASDLVAGVAAGVDTDFGTADDVKINEVTPDALFSKIASVTIKGMALGAVNGTAHFGIVAEQVGTVKVGVRSYILAPGTDTTGLVLGTTTDIRVREV